VHEKILKVTDSKRLKVYFVWTAVLPGDTRKVAEETVREVPDERATHFWDKDRSLGLAFAQVVSLPGDWELAWDVYFAYDAKKKWGNNPPAPTDWMHQLGRDRRWFDATKLRVVVEELLAGIPCAPKSGPVNGR
jgi:hypothetical protein